MQHRFESIDSLRGLAALTVFLQHFNTICLILTPTATPFIFYSPLHIFFDGKAAVDFFFVLSGFVLSYRFVRDNFKDLHKLEYGPYVIARIFRIFPLPFVIITFCAIITFIVPLVVPAAASLGDFPVWQQHFSLTSYLKQISLVWVNINPEHYAPQTWTLKLEVILSALVPFMILLAQHRVGWLVSFTFAFIFLFVMPPFILHFTMGILLAIYLPRITEFMRSKGRGFKIGMLLTGLLLYSYSFSVAAYLPAGILLRLLGDRWGFFVNFVIGCGVILIIITTLNSATLKSILHHASMKLIGKISFSIYLCHYMLFVLVLPRLMLALNNAGITSRPGLVSISLVAILALTIALSCLLYYTVEKPGIAMGKKAIALYHKLLSGLRQNYIA